jgi:hypothetical protein
MTNRPLIIGQAQQEDISKVVSYAEQHSYSYEQIMVMSGGRMASANELQQKSDPDLPAIGDDPGHCCVFPVGFRCVFSIEQQPAPLNWCRHISISVSGKGMPNPVAVDVILQEFGFRHAVAAGGNIVYIENDRAINVIEPLEELTAEQTERKQP